MIEKAPPASGFYPHQVPIDFYGNGGFRFAEMSHHGSLLCLPTGMHAWPVTQPGDITLESLELAIACADDLDVLFIGLGEDIGAIPSQLRQALRAQNIILEAVSTGSAIRTYNVLFGERRAVGAALIAVEHAGRK